MSPRLHPGPERTIPTACPSGFRYLRLASAATTLQLAECLLWLRASSGLVDACQVDRSFPLPGTRTGAHRLLRDRKSTRLNSSHVKISYAVFCLKKKTKP